ncbi:MAG: SpoIID/LytB domain-containing protein [Candidatus Ratteibacteria bacterium]|nr:SpoIID/LytB domain-containing protein [Candidatus Ratteibacteria bacterium]
MHRYIQKKVLVSLLLLTGITFCQEIRVCVKKTGDRPVISTLDIEKYVMGVISKEMGPEWPEEALKAQAVASRTYAVYMANESRKKGLHYDIENSIFNQVYEKTNSEKIRRVVENTAGEILTYNGDIVQVFFHSTCGGKTARTSDVWGGEYKHISSVDDPYCANTPCYSWEKSLSNNHLSQIFGVSSIEKIVIEERDATGRVTSLKLSGNDGKIIFFTGHKFRIMVNEGKDASFNSPDIIPSTNFNVRKEGGFFIFTGTGYGHGVGMCQWGAKKMAENGFDYRQILKYYFPEMEISCISSE